MLQKVVFIESQLKEKAFPKFTSKPNTFPKKPFQQPNTSTYKKPFETKPNEIINSGNEKKIMKSSQVECFKCRGRGHYASSCPNNRVMVLKGER